jgi:predicted DNA-binding protein
MAIVKQKEKNSYHHLGLRISEDLQNRIDNTFNQVLTVQPEIKKAELIRDAIERGLTEIEQQLKAVDKV